MGKRRRRGRRRTLRWIVGSAEMQLQVCRVNAPIAAAVRQMLRIGNLICKCPGDAASVCILGNCPSWMLRDRAVVHYYMLAIVWRRREGSGERSRGMSRGRTLRWSRRPEEVAFTDQSTLRHGGDRDRCRDRGREEEKTEIMLEQKQGKAN